MNKFGFALALVAALALVEQGQAARGRGLPLAEEALIEQGVGDHELGGIGGGFHREGLGFEHELSRFETPRLFEELARRGHGPFAPPRLSGARRGGRFRGRGGRFPGAVGGAFGARGSETELGAFGASRRDDEAGLIEAEKKGLLAGRKDFSVGENLSGDVENNNVHKHQVLEKERTRGVNDLDINRNTASFNQGSVVSGSESGLAAGSKRGKIAAERDQESQVGAVGAEQREGAVGAVGGAASF